MQAEIDEPAPIEGGEGAPLPEDVPHDPATANASASGSASTSATPEVEEVDCQMGVECEVYGDGTSVRVDRAQRLATVHTMGKNYQGPFIRVDFTYTSGAQK